MHRQSLLLCRCRNRHYDINGLRTQKGNTYYYYDTDNNLIAMVKVNDMLQFYYDSSNSPIALHNMWCRIARPTNIAYIIAEIELNQLYIWNGRLGMSPNQMQKYLDYHERRYTVINSNTEYQKHMRKITDGSYFIKAFCFKS